MRRYVSFRDFDWVLLTFVLLICVMGVVQIYSATLNTKFSGANIKQIYWIAAGLAMRFLVGLISYRGLLEKVHWMYVLSVLYLVEVLFFGKGCRGARRWMHLPWG